jgi:1-acyl-sn-glycerol-3-phosphate acyltransferase
MKVNKIKAYWIVLRSVFCVFIISLVAIYIVCFKKGRQAINDISYYWTSTLLKFVKATYKISNPYHVKFESHKRYILMSNHASLYDIPLIYMAFPHTSIRMIAKKELLQVPIWGSAMRGSEFISIDRNNPRQAIKDLQLAKEKLESGIVIWIAPEGTRTRTGKLGKFKKGGFMLAQKAGAIIIPIGIKGSDKILPAKTFEFSVGEHVEINIGKPIDAASYAKAQRSQLMLDVEDSIRELIR